MSPTDLPPPPAPGALRPEFPGARWQPVLYIALSTVILALVWWLPALPTQDGPSHVYNLVVLRDLLAGTGPWARAYVADLHLSPNLGFILFGLPLLKVASPEVVERLFVSVYVIVVLTGVPFLLRTFRHPALPLSLLAIPVVFNYGFLFGFYSYSLAAALLIPALALLWRSRDARLAVRAARVTVTAFALWPIHLLPAGMFVVAAAWLELSRSPEAPGRTGRHRRWLASIAVSAPAAVAMAAFAVVTVGPHGSTAVVWHHPLVLAFLFLTFASAVLGPGQVWLALAIAAWIALAIPWRAWRADHPGRFLGGVAAFVLALTVSAPNSGFAGAYLNERLPWLIPIVAAPLLRPPAGGWWERVRPLHGPVLAVVATAALALCAAGLTAQSRIVEEFRAGTDVEIALGSTLMTARYRPRPLWPLYDPLMHAASWYALRGAIDLGNYEAAVPYFPVRFRTDLPPSPDPDTVYFSPRRVDWSAARTVDYLLAWGTGDRDRATLARQFSLRRQMGDLSVWERR
jgi:hypothetical protein